MVLLEGSCHCKTINFQLRSRTPYPYMHCYCTICRKTGGGTGAVINIMGEAETFKVDGLEHVGIYVTHDKKLDGTVEVGHNQRSFCRKCGSHLWAWSPKWPQYIYPTASSIDTALPKPPQRYHIMLDFKAPWVEVPEGPNDKQFAQYPSEGIEQWHKQNGLLVDL